MASVSGEAGHWYSGVNYGETALRPGRMTPETHLAKEAPVWLRPLVLNGQWRTAGISWAFPTPKSPSSDQPHVCWAQLKSSADVMLHGYILGSCCDLKDMHNAVG